MSDLSRLGLLFQQRRRLAGSLIGRRRDTMGALTALSGNNDPYRQEVRRAEGEWFARWFNELCPERALHLRGFHYLLVTSSIVKPNGEPYRNTDDDWEWLGGPSVAARWLGLLPFNRIVDQRNEAPVFAVRNRAVPTPQLNGGYVYLPDADDVKIEAGIDNFHGKQPFTLAVFGEKGSLGPMLEPICQRFGADLFLPTGEISTTQTFEMAMAAAQDGRPLVLFTVSDCDPAGYQMPVSIARKLQALRDKDFPSLEFKVVPIALEPRQAAELDLPSTPLKETERRGDKWREAHGREQTEIDAALALAPDWLRDTITREMSRFYDSTLQQRVIDARREWQAEADRRIEEEFGEELEAWREDVERIEQQTRDTVEAINDRLEEMASSIELPTVHTPVGEPPPDDGRGVLIDSRWSWFDQTQRLKDRKAYIDDEGGTA
jgi:hypothetical protein